jgi:hypothetical protein
MACTQEADDNPQLLTWITQPADEGMLPGGNPVGKITVHIPPEWFAAGAEHWETTEKKPLQLAR